MKLARVSPCGRFVVLDGLHLDRGVFAALELWATQRGVSAQDAIQLALCAFGDSALARLGPREREGSLPVAAER